MFEEVRLDPSGIELVLPRGWESRASEADARWAKEAGYLTQDSTRAGVLRVAWEQWNTLAAGPSSTDMEEQDWWCDEHERLSRLLGIGHEHVVLEEVGHVGGAHLRVRLVVNGFETSVHGASVDALASVFYSHRPLSPLTFRVAQRVGEFAVAATHTRGEQLALIARLKETQALIRQFPRLRARLTLDLSPHLESFEIEQPPEFAAKWVDEGSERLTLQLFAKGASTPLPLDSLDESSPVVDLGGRKSVLLNPAARAVATQARAYQRTRRKRVDPAVLQSPLALLGDGADTEGVDFSEYALEDFSHRVIGFEVPTRTKQTLEGSSGTAWYERDGTASLFVVMAQTPNGAEVRLELGSPEEALQVAADAERTRSSGESSMEVQGRRILPSAELSNSLRGLVRLARNVADNEPPATPGAAPRPARLQPVLEDIAAAPPAVPSAPTEDLEGMVPWDILEGVLASDIRLKAHQRVGIAWLWHRYTSGTPGALLADDMGLGKTLQLACFVALAKASPRKARERRPTLIVAPVILIANWREELTRFFQGEFPGRVLELRDDTLRAHRTASGGLDRDRIRAHDVVITSYETLARYATSLLGIAWDVAILDEAQRIKNRGTSYSIAARALSGLDDPTRPRKFEFGICATGTPVENSVNDLWALYDFLSPGSPFGSYQDFAAEYGNSPDAPRALAARLAVGSSSSSLFRRTKAEVLPHELPSKSYRTIPVEMTPFQREQERIITSGSSRRGGFLRTLQSLQKLYQHPWLLDEDGRSTGRDLDEAVATSPKLAECLRLLSRIREQGEKVLVFTLWTDMQHLLTDVIAAKLGLPRVSIINGDPKNRSRAMKAIRDFSASPGFDVMVLSPLAAGMGLNIVAANHVIHYGRWWNPAKEDQATDRAYRIGQTRPVTVYYPVLHHPGRPDQGFDVKLDQLVGRKRDMARALLEPVDRDDLEESELDMMRGDQ